jgi:hypothetical protein
MYHLVGDIKLDHSSTKLIISCTVAFVVNQRGLGVPAKKWGFKKVKDFRISRV